MDGNPFKVIKYGYCPVDFPTNPLSSSPCGAEFVTAFDPSIRIDDKLGPPPMPAPPALRPTWPKGSATWPRPI